MTIEYKVSLEFLEKRWKAKRWPVVLEELTTVGK